VPFTYTDYHELLNRNDIDVIIVATPPSTHEEIVIEALKAGKYVICEKPLAHTLESADRIIEEAVKYKNRLSVCYQFRFMPEIQRIIWLRDNGWLGDLDYGNFKRITPISGALQSNYWGKWGIAGGGVVMTQFIHQLDMMIHIFGKPASVFAEMDTLQQNIESEDTFAATIRFETGAIVSCSATLNAHRISTLFDVIGARASAHLPWAVYARDNKHLKDIVKAMTQAELITKSQRQGLMQKIKNQFSGDSLPVKIMQKLLSKLGIQLQIGSPPLHRSFIAAFIDALRDNRELPMSAEEARKSLELCIAIYTSAINKEVVYLPLQKSNSFYKGITLNAYRDQKKI
jgi:predicted dehydrogenase